MSDEPGPPRHIAPPTLERAAHIAVIGVGSFGRFALDAYRNSPDIEVVAASDANPEALRELPDPGIRPVGDWRDLARDDSIDAVHVATPPFARSDIVRCMQDARKSVFCEKPLALTLADADAMIENSRRTRTALGADYVMRHLPAYRLLDELLELNAFGEVRSISFVNFAQSVPPGHWFWDRAKSGGILVEHGVHFFDAFERFAGNLTEVWGHAPRPESIEVTLRHDTGVVTRYYHEFAFPKQVEHTIGTVFCERGYVEIEGWIPEKLQARVMVSPGEMAELVRNLSHPVEVHGYDIAELDAKFENREKSYADAISAGMRDLIMRHRDPAHQMKVTADDARESLRLAIAAQDAADSP